MEAMPRTNKLYRQIAKDYQPKQAEMNICKYVEALEERLTALEQAHAQLEAKVSAEPTRRRRATADSEVATEE